MEKKILTRLMLSVLLWSLALIAAGRITTHFTSLAATDVAFPEWVSFVTGLIAELIVCARIVVGYSGLTQCVYHPLSSAGTGRRTALPGMLALVLILSFTDYLARFVIDFASGSILGTEMLAAVWLLMQYLYEAVFIVMSMLLILLTAGKYRAAETEHSRRRYDPAAAVRVSVLLTLLSRVILEIVSIVQFVSTYTDITSAETASMIGSVVRVIVIYGGGALLIGEFFTDLFSPRTESPAEA